MHLGLIRPYCYFLDSCVSECAEVIARRFVKRSIDIRRVVIQLDMRPDPRCYITVADDGGSCV